MSAAADPGLIFSERAAVGAPSGLLILHHGRGSDEQDLLELADVLDPDRRLHVVTPRAPLQLAGSPGYHWYLVPRVGYPDRQSFRAAFTSLAAFHDALWQRTGIAPSRTVLGGFSMGSVMSYALGLPTGRPAPAGLLIFAGFVPTVEGWQMNPASVAGLPVFIAHGRRDPVMAVAFARQARELLTDAGASVAYHESDAGHFVDPPVLPVAAAWLRQTVPDVAA